MPEVRVNGVSLYSELTGAGEPEVQARIDAVAELLRDGEHEQAAHLVVDTIAFGRRARRHVHRMVPSQRARVR